MPSAVERGIKEARGRIVSWFDCDLSVAPENLARFRPLIKKYDLVLGSTFIDGGADIRGHLPARFFSSVINKLAQLILTPQITDYTSGLIMARKTALAGTRFDGTHGAYFIGLLYRAYKHRLKIIEVPYQFGRRGYGVSKISGPWSYFKASLVYLRTLLLTRFFVSSLLYLFPLLTAWHSVC